MRIFIKDRAVFVRCNILLVLCPNVRTLICLTWPLKRAVGGARRTYTLGRSTRCLFSKLGVGEKLVRAERVKGW